MFGMFTLLTKPLSCCLCLLMCISLCAYNACVCVGMVSEEHKELQQLHSCKNEEQEGVVLRLQSELRSTHDELDEMRSTLRTLKGTDGRGLRHVYTLMFHEKTGGKNPSDLHLMPLNVQIPVNYCHLNEIYRKSKRNNLQCFKLK